MPKTTTSQPAPATEPDTGRGQGLRDVSEAVRSLARNSRDVLTDAGEVLEREIAMAVSVSEGLRDQTVSPAFLADARAVRVQSGLRASAHRAVDLVADAVGVATITASRFAEALVDDPRPERVAAIESSESAASGQSDDADQPRKPRRASASA